VSYDGLVDTDVVFIEEPKQFLSFEFCAIVGDDGVRNPKLMANIAEEEHGLLRFDLGDWSHFYPLGELVNSNKQVRVSLSAFFRGPTRSSPQTANGHMIGIIWSLSWQMGLPSVVLAPFTS
jgi:hypothetical protein